MHFIHRFKIVFLLLLFMGSQELQAQFKNMNMPYHDNKKIFFGVTFGYNRSDFKVVHSPLFTYNDSIKIIESGKGPGFNIGMVSNLRLVKNLDLRCLPSLSFAERYVYFTEIPDTQISKTIESINLEIPFDVRLKSDRYGNFRVYALSGVKIAYDLNSNAKNRKLKDQIKVDSYDLALTYGGGFSFYFPMFILSPEIKIYQGLLNTFAPNPDLKYSNMIDKLRMRTILFTIHIEG